MPTQTYHTPADENLKSGVIENRSPSVGHMFRDRIAKTPQREAFRFPRGEQWESMTWAQVDDRVRKIAAGLISLGIEPQQRVALASSTRIEWALADFGVMCAGAATTTVYPSTMPDDVAYIIADSGSRVVFAEDDVQVGKLREKRDEIPEVIKVVTFDGATDGDWVISLEDLERLGEEHLGASPNAVDERIDDLSPDKLATIIYTSGTTGRPKGVRLRHDAWSYECAANDAIDQIQEDDLQYLWLPLAHVFGKLMVVLPLQIGFPTAIDGRIDKIVENLGIVKPTFMAAAPRIFEKAYGGVNLMMKKDGGAKLKLYNWSTDVAGQVADLWNEGKQPSGLLAAKYAVADKLVLSKIRERFGGRIRFFVSGSAPLNTDIARWFDGVGMRISEGYGLTESSAGSTVGRMQAHRRGTVGWTFPGTEIKIAGDGEILLRGPGVMEGYHNNPEATAEVLTEDGWFHTGDIGEVDERGFVKITDRKKDLFKTSGGKYIAPSVIESQFKGICPYVSQFLVHGAGRNYATALVTLDPEGVKPWAAANGLENASYEEIANAPQTRDMVQRYIDELNSQLNRWETIKKFTILGQDLTVEGGELTPSLKMRRKIVTERYQDHLDSMYGENDS
ncbi:MAG: long-chain fatty acid--CoA ligase [Micrococcales bacterium]|nr:long-chain fatty acid--CoA ligase [Micrococcales bacterium]